MWTWLSKMMWALRYVIRSAFAGPYVPLPTVPYKIASNPNHVPTGPNLLENGGFENGTFDAAPATETIVTGSGFIDGWLVLQDGGSARWIDAAHPTFSKAAEGNRFVDLTGGTLPGPTRTLATLIRPFLGLQAGKSYEVSLDLGVGPFNGLGANFGPPIKVRVRATNMAQLEQEFLCNPLDYPINDGVKWETFKFRFAIPAGYPLSQLTANNTIKITGTYGNQFIGVDNVSVRLLT